MINGRMTLTLSMITFPSPLWFYLYTTLSCFQPVHMADFSQVQTIQTIAFDNKGVLQIKIAGATEPLTITCASTAEAEDMADLIDGYCRLVHDVQNSLWTRKGQNMYQLLFHLFMKIFITKPSRILFLLGVKFNSSQILNKFKCSFIYLKVKIMQYQKLPWYNTPLYWQNIIFSKNSWCDCNVYGLSLYSWNCADHNLFWRSTRLFIQPILTYWNVQNYF